MTGLLEQNRAALLVIDVQDRINAVMADQSHLPRIEVLVEACRGLDVPVLASEQYPQGLGPTVKSLAIILGNTPPGKLTFSCARDDGLKKAIEDSGRNQIIVTGIETHVCVLQTALDLISLSFEIFIPHDAVNSRRPAETPAARPTRSGPSTAWPPPVRSSPPPSQRSSSSSSAATPQTSRPWQS